MLFAPRGRVKMSAVVISLAATPALAETPAPASQDPTASEATSITLHTIEVISQQLEAARLRSSRASAPALIILDRRRWRRFRRAKMRL